MNKEKDIIGGLTLRTDFYQVTLQIVRKWPLQLRWIYNNLHKTILYSIGIIKDEYDDYNLDDKY